jgi:hypothetical protein
MRTLWAAVAFGLAVATLGGQATTTTIIGFADLPAYTPAGWTVAFDIDTASDGVVSCGNARSVGTERHCEAVFNRATTQTIRLRVRVAPCDHDSDPATPTLAECTSVWSEGVSAPAVAAGSPPGAYTIHFAGPLGQAPPPPPPPPPTAGATRFYLPSTGTPSVSPAFNGTVWNGGTGFADRRTMLPARINSAATTKSGSPGPIADGQFELLRQYLSPPLAAQTISGSFKGQLRAIVTNFGARAMALRLCKVSADGVTVTEVLARFSAGDAGGAAPPAYTTSLTNRRFETGTNTFTITFPDITMAAGEFLMLEIGNRSGSSNAPRIGTVAFGDDAASDLPEDESTTTAGNPWVEFTDTIVFVTP